MATSVRHGPNGPIYQGVEAREVPDLDILTLLYDSIHTSATDDAILHVSAADPSLALNKVQVVEQLQKVAYLLRNSYGIGEHGAGKDIVSVISSGHHLIPVAIYGVVAAGGVFSAASAASTASDLAGQLKQCESKVLICNDDTKQIALEGARQAGVPENRVLVIGNGASMDMFEARSGKKLQLSKKLDWERVTSREELENRVICLIFSSGTTGLPKAVQLTHRNIVAEAVLCQDPVKEYNRVTRPNFEYRTLAHLPIAHIAGIQGYIFNPPYMGGPCYWMPRFDFAKFLEYNRRYRITFFFSVPPIYLLIAKSQEVKDHFDSLRIAISGAAPLGAELQKQASLRFGQGTTMIAQTWGLSETTGSITTLPQGWSDFSGSVSCLIAGHSARCIDDNDKDVPVGQPGEIIVKGPVVTKGYYNNDKVNAESYLNGWFRTGDIGLFKNGMFYIVDRKKELIKYKGLQVAPAELEALLLTHDDIKDAAVIGVDGEGTEVPRAYVVADESKISASQIAQFVADKVSNHKKLRGGVILLKEIPKSPSGKILRKDLREMAKRGELSTPKL